MEGNIVTIDRAPVLTLWGAVVAERMGYDREAALSFGKAVAGLNAQSKGRMLGIFGEPKASEGGGPPRKAGLGEEFWVRICGRAVPARNMEAGTRAVVKDRPIEPGTVQKYLEGKFGESLEVVRRAMEELAAAFEPDALEEAAYGLYEKFRPSIAPGKRGWGQKGELDLKFVRSLARRRGDAGTRRRGDAEIRS